MYEIKPWDSSSSFILSRPFVYSLIAVCLMVFGTLSYQWMQTASIAKKTQQENASIKKETKEASEVFASLVEIRTQEKEIESNKAKIDKLNEDNEARKVIINKEALKIEKYGVKSVSVYIN